MPPLLLLLVLLASCTPSPHIDVQGEFFTREKLASYRVGTPDPLLQCYQVEQRLTLSWALPASYQSYWPLTLELTLRFACGEEKKVAIPLPSMRGSTLYRLTEEEWCEKGGVTTYKVLLFGEGGLLEEWRHSLWVERLILD